VQTVSATLRRGVELLEHRSPTAHADAQILLAHVLRRERGWLVAHGESILPSAQIERFAELCRQRANGMPVAYITGTAGFYGREFVVNEHVLIPRPETEHLAEEAIAHLRAQHEANGGFKRVLTVFEAGVGSGALSCTIAAEVPNVSVEGSDVSPEALAVAQLNAKRLNVHARCKFVIADAAQRHAEKRYDVIVANLPYIPSADVPLKPDPVAYEPRVALDGGADGLDAYRRLLADVPSMLRAGGLLLLEAAPPTIEALRALTEHVLPSAGVEVRRDYAGQERYVRASTGASPA
jgi:release factor glutamine methyltransferase